MFRDDGFGRIITAMVTPFTPDGELDLDATQRLARWLTEDRRNDGLVVNGTTGESATTSDEEKAKVLAAVVEAVSGRARVIAGVGSSDTRHSLELAAAAEAAGADGLMAVSPYYLRPSQEGLLRHFLAIADRTSLPVMLYDIPKRTGVAIEPDTAVRAAEHPRIQALKDAKGDLEATSWVMRRSSLAVYGGEDVLNLPLLAIGASGFVSVAGHLVASELRALLSAYRRGAIDIAVETHQRLLPIYKGLFRGPAAAMTKAALEMMGHQVGPVRAPLVALTDAERERLAEDIRQTGLKLPEPAAVPR